jgi:hypothetical protein
MSEPYQCKAAGPRMRILVENPDQLSNKIVLLGFLDKGEQVFKVEYDGLLMQCHHCRSWNHLPSIAHNPERIMTESTLGTSPLPHQNR